MTHDPIARLRADLARPIAPGDTVLYGSSVVRVVRTKLRDVLDDRGRAWPRVDCERVWTADEIEALIDEAEAGR